MSIQIQRPDGTFYNPNMYKDTYYRFEVIHAGVGYFSVARYLCEYLGNEGREFKTESVRLEVSLRKEDCICNLYESNQSVLLDSFVKKDAKGRNKIEREKFDAFFSVKPCRMYVGALRVFYYQNTFLLHKLFSKKENVEVLNYGTKKFYKKMKPYFI